MEIKSFKTFESGVTAFTAKKNMTMSVLVKTNDKGGYTYQRTSSSYIGKDGKPVYKDCYFPVDNADVMKKIEEAVESGKVRPLTTAKEGVIGFVEVTADWWIDLRLTKNDKIALPERIVKDPKDEDKKTRPVFWLEEAERAEALDAIHAELEKQTA